MTDEKAIATLKTLADLFTDGHFTIYKFTGNWRVCLGTVSMDLLTNEYHYHDVINRMPCGKTLGEAVERLIEPIKNAVKEDIDD